MTWYRRLFWQSPRIAIKTFGRLDKEALVSREKVSECKKWMGK